METTKHYKDLLVWQKAIDLAEYIYTLTKEFPKEETYGLVSQTRRCSISIASNIAEGQARDSSEQFLHFLAIAKGSVAELDTQIIVAKRLNYISEEKYKTTEQTIAEVSKMLSGLIRAIK